MAAEALDITENLTCSICISLYERPKALPCLHTFCESCIGNHLTTTQTNGTFLCPICKAQTDVPEKGAEGLKDHFDFVLMIEKVREAKKRKRQSLDLKPLCSTHTTEPLNVFCNSCNAHICAECSFSEHKGHEFISPKVACRRTDETVRHHMDSIKSAVDRAKKREAEIKEAQGLCTSEQTRVLGEISDYFGKVRAAVDAKEHKMKKDVHESAVSLITQLESSREAFQKKRSAMNEAWSSAQQVMANANEVVRMQNHHSVLDQLLKVQPDGEETKVMKPAFSFMYDALPEIKVDLSLNSEPIAMATGNADEDVSDTASNASDGCQITTRENLLHRAQFVKSFSTTIEGMNNFCLGIAVVGGKFFVFNKRDEQVEVFWPNGMFQRSVKCWEGVFDCPLDEAFGNHAVFPSFIANKKMVLLNRGALVHWCISEAFSKGELAYDRITSRLVYRVSGSRLAIVNKINHYYVELILNKHNLGLPEFNPFKVDVASNGLIVVSDNVKQCVYIIIASRRECTRVYRTCHLEQFGRRIRHLCCDNQGRILVLVANHRIHGPDSLHVMTTEGEYLHLVDTSERLYKSRGMAISGVGEVAIIGLGGIVSVIKYLE